MAQKKEPAWSYRIEDIRAAIWANQSNGGAWMNTTITRRYKDGDEWKETTSWRPRDLPIVRVLADMAHDWIRKQEPAEAVESNE
jgi:hypothetical protein